ncbi:MAG: hypothetical protein IT258_15700 [Saprospiraceae bacterium]|nr:hypothetical protein [Saprospiraceae bacterium]
MAWIFKIESLNDIRPILNGEEKWVFELTQKRNFGGKEGDDVILLVLKEGEWVFTHSCEILEVEGRDKQDEDGTRYMLITIGNFEVINQPNKLDDFSYTLTRINRFKDPIWHFRRKYAHIEMEEFKAITNGELFVSRTVFGKLVNSLHKDHRLNFFRTLIDEKPELFFNPAEYLEAFRFLKAYLENNLFQHVEWLTQTYDMLQDLVDEETLEQIGFADSAEDLAATRFQPRKTERIASHVLKISQNQVLGNQQSLLVELEGEIQQSRENERTFNRLFRNRQLPIQFNF